MNISDAVFTNLGQDFATLSSISPTGSLTCNVVVGFGSCRKGVLSEQSEIESIFLRSPEEFDFSVIQRLVAAFNAQGHKKPFFQSLLLCVNLVVPFQRSLSGFVHRLYEIEASGNDILLKRQSMREG